jgi:hypothetical protein
VWIDLLLVSAALLPLMIKNKVKREAFTPAVVETATEPVNPPHPAPEL